MGEDKQEVNLGREYPSNSQMETAIKFVTSDALKQQCLLAAPGHQECYLAYVLTEFSGATAIVFTRRCDSTRFLALMLQNLGMRAVPINGLMSQAERVEALNKFTGRDCNILVCSDGASRGLEVSSMDVIINYDIPSNWEDYIHRVGRAAANGFALAMINVYEMGWFLEIEKRIGRRLTVFEAREEEVLQLLEPLGRAKTITNQMLNC